MVLGHFFQAANKAYAWHSYLTKKKDPNVYILNVSTAVMHEIWHIHHTARSHNPQLHLWAHKFDFCNVWFILHIGPSASKSRLHRLFNIPMHGQMEPLFLLRSPTVQHLLGTAWTCTLSQRYEHYHWVMEDKIITVIVFNGLLSKNSHYFG